MPSETVRFQVTSAASKILRHICDRNISFGFYLGTKRKQTNAYVPCFLAIHSRQRMARIGAPSPPAIFKGNAAN